MNRIETAKRKEKQKVNRKQPNTKSIDTAKQRGIENTIENNKTQKRKTSEQRQKKTAEHKEEYKTKQSQLNINRIDRQQKTTKHKKECKTEQ